MFKKKRRWHCLKGQPITELDKQVMYWENKGKLVPTRDLIKTPEQIYLKRNWQRSRKQVHVVRLP